MDDLTGVSDQGTGEVQESQVVDTPLAPDVNTSNDVNTSTEQNGVAEEQLDPKTAGLMREIQETNAKLQRQVEYNEFLKGLSQAPKNQNNIEMPDLDDEDVTYVKDVKALIRAEMAQAREQERLDRFVGEIEDYGNKQREADANFDSRMNLANEILKYKPEYGALVDAQRTPKDIVRVMENIAMEHPMYSNFTAKTVQSNQDAINRLKANAQLPQTLTGIQGSGPATKLPSQMSEEEYMVYKEEVKRRA